MRSKIVCALWGVLLPFLVQGQVPERPAGDLGELVTDRPDFTESSEVVGRDVAQWEMGSVMEFDRAAGTRTLSMGTPLLRIWALANGLKCASLAMASFISSAGVAAR